MQSDPKTVAMSLIYTVPAASGQPRNSIYIGGKNDAKSLDRLGRWGISHILNVTPTKDTSIQVRNKKRIFCSKDEAHDARMTRGKKGAVEDVRDSWREFLAACLVILY